MRFPFRRSAPALTALVLLFLAPAAVPAPRKAATNLRLNPAYSTVGGKTTLYAYLTRKDNDRGLPGQEVVFRVASNPAVTDTTETSIGVASVEFYVGNNRPGTYRVLAQFKGDEYFARSTASGTLTVRQGTCVFALQMNPQSAPLNQPYTLGAMLVNRSGLGIKSRRVKVEINNRPWRTLTTDADGVAKYPYTFPQPGPHTVQFTFDGDGFFHKPDPLRLTIQVK